MNRSRIVLTVAALASTVVLALNVAVAKSLAVTKFPPDESDWQ